ncbi:MAG: CBS domain-containing protein [SAR202 cluster bacterium]|nr:CBS domain-containing protein [SAR202 cluster bacterium]
MEVQEVMSSYVHTVEQDESVAAAARKMREGDVGSLVVTSSGSVKGVITDRDLTVRCMSQGHDYQKCRVSDHMGGPAITVGPASDMLDAAAMMAGRKIRRLPVVDGDKLIGLVSLSDIALSIDSALVSMNSTLHDLLSGMGAARST